MKRAWWDSYIGLPYLERGRGRDGVDCWGLVRLVHAEQFNNELPALSGDYDNVEDRAHLSEIVARERESWQKVDVPREGDVAVFRILGEDSHVGVVTAPGEFLHVRAGQKAVIERLESPMWKTRLEGVYRYCTAATPVEYSAAAHPLRTERIEGMIPAGRTISQTIEHLKAQQGVSPDMPYQATVWVNGREVNSADWEHVIPAPGSRVEVRAVARGSTAGRMVAMIAVMVVAWYLAPMLAGAALGVPAALVSPAAISVAQTALTMAGSLLVNAIFPVRPPETNTPGSPEAQKLLQGGSNAANPYGAIPVVLGRFRYTPPVAANTYVENDATTSYLRMALAWGYGPLQVSDVRIGNVSIESYEEVEIETLEGITGEEQTRFNAIYGRDVEQIAPQIELTCPAVTVQSASRTAGVVTVNTQGAHNFSSGQTAWLTDPMSMKGDITVVSSTQFTFPSAGQVVGAEMLPMDLVWRNWTSAETTVVGWTQTASTAGPTLVSELTGTAKVMSFSHVGANLVANQQYRVSMRLANVNAGTTGKLYPAVGSTPLGTGFGQVADGVYEAIVTPTTAGAFGFHADAEWQGTVTEFTCKPYYAAGEDMTITSTKVRSSAWNEYTLIEEADKLTISLHFPVGLQQSPVEGGNAGEIDPALYRGSVQVRQLDSATLQPITSWGEVDRPVAATRARLPSAWYNVDSDQELEPVYQWHRFSVDEYGKVIVRAGALTNSQNANPTGNLLRRLQEDNFGFGITFERLPLIPDGEELLYDICVQGNNVVSSIRKADTTITGCDLTSSTNRTIVLTSGSIWRAYEETVALGNSGEPFYKRKDAFTHNVSFNVARGVYQVRVRRTNESNDDFEYPSGNAARRSHTCFLQAITASSSRRPIVPPKPMAMTAIRIKATDQINGNVSGVTATVQSICLDWDRTTTTWVERPTRNPASLLRYVLQHPANAKRVADSALDLTALQDFHEHCRVNGFMFDAVLTEQRSLWDVMLDVAAAGRASPTMRDGKWTVVIDKPRTSIVQHFTPHNSWGFEGVRALPKMPHGFRVQFNNAQRGYQPDEMIVYSDGYTSANATVLEGLQLPGVTEPNIIFKQARFHLAQARLRPESYTLNADIEHLVCTRGDLVRVTHDVPMWGLGTGRIKDFTAVPKLTENIAQDYTLWTAGTMPAGFTLNGTAAENAMQTGTGPGGHNEPLWTCINADANTGAEGPDGGFNSTAVSADCTKGHLYAVFVKTMTHDGQTYFGPVNNSILNLDGTANTNPYFHGGVDLPALDTWYLAVGYVHPIGYTGASANISGLYQLDGTKVVGHSEFKYATGATSVNHRAYHYYNAVISTPNPVQQMARPVIVQCTTAGASAQIAKILAHGSGSIVLDEEVPMDAGVQYTMRARTATGTSVVRTISPKDVDGYYSNVEPTTSVTAAQVAAGNLFMFGALNQESVELVVQAVEPADNMSARVTMVDYSPAVYDSDLEVIPAWNSQITEPPVLQRRVITATPNIRQLVSDETVMLRAPSGGYRYGIKLAWTNPRNLPRDVDGVQAEIDYANDGRERWANVQAVPLTARSVTFMDLREGENYVIRLRYVARDGNTGPWVRSAIHEVVGKTTPPTAVQGVTVTPSGRRLLLSWDANPEIDVIAYEVRTANTGFGTAGYVYRGRGTSTLVDPPAAAGTTTTWYVRALDAARLYSLTSASAAYARVAPAAPGAITATVSDTATTASQVTFNWPDSSPVFGLQHYRADLTLPGGAVRSVRLRASEWTTNYNWTGDATLALRVVDVHGLESAATTLVFSKGPPNQVGTVTASVGGAKLLLNWPANARTSLPIAGYEVRTADSGWGTAGYLHRGTSSQCWINGETLVTGNNTFYVKAFDTDGKYSTLARSVVYSRAAVSTPSGLVATYADTSTTDATVLLNWTDSTSPFTIRYYVCELTLPDLSVRRFTARASEWSTRANWVGTATLSIVAHDLVGATSAAATLSVVKSAPNQVGTVTTSISGNRLILNWPALVRTTLPVAGYEVRLADSGWGTTGYIYRGSASACVISAETLAANANTWYVKAFDTDGEYSTLSRSVSYNLSPVTVPTSLAAAFTDTSTTDATVRFTWAESSSPFGIERYISTLTLPDTTTRVVRGDANEWTTRADWIGTATLSVQARDNAGFFSTAASLSVTKSAPGQVGTVTTTISGNKLLLNWPATVRTTLPVAGYEVRLSDTGWGTAGYLYRGNASYYYVSAETLAANANTWYIRAFDTDGEYSTLSRSASYNLSPVTTPSGLTAAFTDTSTTDATVRLNWNESTSPFGIQRYIATLTLPDTTTRTVKVDSSEWTTRADWVGTATLSVQARDNAGFFSSSATLSVTLSAPNNVGTVTKAVVKGNISLSWSDVAKTTLPVAGYEVRRTDSGWGTASYAYRGASSAAPAIRMILGTNNFYVRAFDTDGNYSAVSASVSHVWDLPPSATALVLTRVGASIRMDATVASLPADLKHIEFRIKKNGTGDVWVTGYDTAVRSQTASVRWRPATLGTYQVAVRLVDDDGNESLSSALASITIARIPAP